MPFVTLEGIDGSGKSEQTGRLVERLRAAGVEALQTKEPDRGHLGAEVRAILTQDGRHLSPTEQLLLVSAARYDHVRSVIAPALASGGWVVSDRFIDSTYAFQVAVSDVDLGLLFKSVNDIVVGQILPDITIILDLPVEAAVARRSARGVEVSDPAETARDFHSIRDALLAVASRDARRCRVVHGDQSPEDVAAAIWREVEALL